MTQGFSSRLFCSLMCLMALGAPSTATANPIGEAGARLAIVNSREKALDFGLSQLNGTRISLQDLQGKVVFLNFWATWCVPCRREMPAMERLHRRFQKQGLSVLAVNTRDAEEPVQTFVEELELTFPIGLDAKGEVASDYRIWSLPTTYIVDPHGKIVGKAIGPREWDSEHAMDYFRELLRNIKELKGGKP